MVAAGGEGTCCVVTRVTRADHAFRLEVVAGRLSATAVIERGGQVGQQCDGKKPLDPRSP